ncbi:WGR domain-containing protein (plasmid) [Nitrobacter sp. NHB1]|uniref:WGR domain-containing protein n=1 Tax=Nitrobacter sp. NHB1 TaxID=3119830 RepID=UPI002FFE4496
MTAIVLTRIGATQNMQRFYKLDVQPDLFGGWSLVREGGVSAGLVRCVSTTIPRAAPLTWPWSATTLGKPERDITERFNRSRLFNASRASTLTWVKAFDSGLP